jgi:hypothetical protein
MKETHGSNKMKEEDCGQASLSPGAKSENRLKMEENRKKIGFGPN